MASTEMASASGVTISVIVPVRDGLPWIEQQLRALSDQRCEVPWEVVVADNGSLDGTRAFAEEWARTHPGVRVRDASARAGPAAARNGGVAVAGGRLLAFCDADDVVQPGWLAACVEALDSADVAAGTFDFTSLNGAPASPPVPAASRQLAFLPAALGANLAVRRSAFDAVGGFAEELAVGEDIDLSWRLQLHGFRFAVAPGAVVAKREPSAPGEILRTAWSYGRSGSVLYRRFRADGMHRDLRGAAKEWLWLLLACPALGRAGTRRQWARTFGLRAGRLAGSVRQGAFFP
jgi:GT2 family glycosyltransferase